MSQHQLQQESRKILHQFGSVKRSHELICPILKVLQMRHKNVDRTQAIEVIKGVLDD